MSEQPEDLRETTEPLLDDERRDQAQDDEVPPEPPGERPVEVDDLEMDDEYHRGRDLVDADPEADA
jgi:hypothetical protein